MQDTQRPQYAKPNRLPTEREAIEEAVHQLSEQNRRLHYGASHHLHAVAHVLAGLLSDGRDRDAAREMEQHRIALADALSVAHVEDWPVLLEEVRNAVRAWMGTVKEGRHQRAEVERLRVENRGLREQLHAFTHLRDVAYGADPGPGVPVYDDVAADLARVVTERDEAKARIDAALHLHRDFKIYDECGHNHTDVDVVSGVAFEMPEVGYVCEQGVQYVVCRACCTEDGYQTEQCVSTHTHGAGDPSCATRIRIDELERVTENAVMPGVARYSTERLAALRNSVSSDVETASRTRVAAVLPSSDTTGEA